MPLKCPTPAPLLHAIAQAPFAHQPAALRGGLKLVKPPPEAAGPVVITHAAELCGTPE